jgi:methylmalonyl-CoA mutase
VFPDLAEAAVAVLDVPPRARSPHQFAIAVDPLTPMRLAEPFEALRDRADAHRAAKGSLPKVFLATLGRPADFAARAAFAKNFFEAGGVAAVTDETLPATAPDADVDLPAIAAAFKASGAKLACLCASDDTYARHGTSAVHVLTSAGAQRVYAVAGPGPHLPSDATIIHAHSDAPEILRDALHNPSR